VKISGKGEEDCGDKRLIRVGEIDLKDKRDYKFKSC
jgi:hypothetical protein